MTAQVIIQPSFGNPTAQRHWADTLAREVDFTGIGSPGSALTDAESETLLGLHPTGSARFWGATAAHDTRMATLQTGDVVLFTGLNHVRAVGEIGASFQNTDFADRLWTPDPDKGSWCNVYSLLSFQETRIPYTELWALPGFTAGDNFMGLRFLNDERSTAILQGLRIETQTSDASDAAAEISTAQALSGTHIVPVEAVNTTTTGYERSGSVLVHRAEALLVQAYREAMPHVAFERLRTPVGITDLYTESNDDVDIVEAKRGADHRYIREALGQLLDYAPHSPRAVTRLNALLPEEPVVTDIGLLHRYGIDCIYRTIGGDFVRREAPDGTRQSMRPMWNA
jgi:hypothetical protein